MQLGWVCPWKPLLALVDIVYPCLIPVINLVSLGQPRPHPMLDLHTLLYLLVAIVIVAVSTMGIFGGKWNPKGKVLVRDQNIIDTHSHCFL